METILDYLKAHQPRNGSINLEALLDLKIERSSWLDYPINKKFKDFFIENNIQFKSEHNVFNQSHVEIGKSQELSSEDRERLIQYAKDFIPWRKGPFKFFEEELDAEWRSDFKWDRIAKNYDIASLIKDKTVLDIGCNDGSLLDIFKKYGAVTKGIEPTGAYKEAKKKGDYLLVSITSDKYVNKGSGRPIFNQNYRAEFLSSLSFIDAIVVNDQITSEKLISVVKPDVYFKGPDYKDNQKDNTKNIYKEIAITKKFGGKIIYSNDITFSSSNLINTHSNYFNKEQKVFLKQISRKYSFDFILKQIKKLNNLKVLLIGETIIDQYIFGDVLGKSGKEPHLVLNEKQQETYLGGAAAIANHLVTFCKSVNFVTLAGKEKHYL